MLHAFGNHAENSLFCNMICVVKPAIGREKSCEIADGGGASRGRCDKRGKTVLCPPSDTASLTQRMQAGLKFALP